MSFQVRFHSCAQAELANAVDWYEQKRIGLGKDFSEEVQKAVGQALEYPETFPQALFSTRCCLVSRFPYCIIYKIIDSVFWIMAVAHTSRCPEYWKDRL